MQGYTVARGVSQFRPSCRFTLFEMNADKGEVLYSSKVMRVLVCGHKHGILTFLE